jgi:EAL domain-containing protein (putative c-di-GMP-specific phosphodiesterase class I)/FixJ family two-component response regulator
LDKERKTVMEKQAIRILIIDDDHFTLKLLGRMLGNLGFTHVSTCSSGYDALEWIDSPDHYPDVILLDLNMPEMDGVEFLHQLTARHYVGSLVLVSGEGERALRPASNLVEAHRIPLLGALGKPVTPKALAALLDKWAPPSVASGPQAAQREYGAEEVRAAIANGELANHYQPKVAVATGRVVGAEALARWRHPADGMVLPGQFVGVTEKHDLIDGLTRAVLAAALAQASRWQQAGRVMQVAVNLSVENLVSPDFADYAAAEAAAAGVPPQQVVLEVAENRLAARGDLSAPLETLTRLRLKHFRLSLDDFGAGHFALAQLRNLPFDEVKIDSRFVHRAAVDAGVRERYEASLAIARQMEMEVVAEGVEDRSDWDFLCNTGCDLAQGYFIARPMPADDFLAWIQDGRARSWT